MNLKAAVLACVDVLATDSNGVCATLTLADLGISSGGDDSNATRFEPGQYYITSFLNGKFSNEFPNLMTTRSFFTHGFIEKFTRKHNGILGKFRQERQRFGSLKRFVLHPLRIE